MLLDSVEAARTNQCWLMLMALSAAKVRLDVVSDEMRRDSGPLIINNPETTNAKNHKFG